MALQRSAVGAYSARRRCEAAEAAMRPGWNVDVCDDGYQAAGVSHAASAPDIDDSETVRVPPAVCEVQSQLCSPQRRTEHDVLSCRFPSPAVLAAAGQCYALRCAVLLEPV